MTQGDGIFFFKSTEELALDEKAKEGFSQVFSPHDTKLLLGGVGGGSCGRACQVPDGLCARS